MGCKGSKQSSDAVVAEAAASAQKMSFGRQPRFLAVIVVHYNPLKFEKRKQLVNDCLDRLRMTRANVSSQNIKLIITAVELTYGGVAREIRRIDDIRYIQRNVPANQIMWSKEQLINIAINDLSEAVKNLVWMDSDIAFEDDSWVEQTIATLQKHPMCMGQPWSQCTLLGPEGEQQRIVSSFAAQHAAGKPYRDFSNRHREYWHPGFCWIATRDALTATNGLIDRTFGSADRHMCMAFMNLADKTYPSQIHPSYKHQVLDWQFTVLANNIKFVCVKGCKIRHYWHGSLTRRKYTERWSILLKHNFDPLRHLKWDSDQQLYLWADEECIEEFEDDVRDYFKERDEDSNEVHAEDLAVDNYDPPPLEIVPTEESSMLGMSELGDNATNYEYSNQFSSDFNNNHVATAVSPAVMVEESEGRSANFLETISSSAASNYYYTINTQSYAEGPSVEDAGSRFADGPIGKSQSGVDSGSGMANILVSDSTWNSVYINAQTSEDTAHTTSSAWTPTPSSDPFHGYA